MSTNPIFLEMLGDTLAAAVVAAQTNCNDTSIMARIEATAVIVSRGGVDLQGGLSPDGAMKFLGKLK